MMIQAKQSNGNTLKDSFYKQRLIKSSANSMYNTFNRTLKVQQDSDDDLPENMTKITFQEEAMNMKQHLKNFGKTSHGPSYAFLTFNCTHKMLKSINIIRQYEFLQQIDLSYNKLKSLKYLSGLKYLVKVVATNNQLSSIFDVKNAPLHLDILNVSNNCITRMSDLSVHKHLRILNLKANKIVQMVGIKKNSKLDILDLSQNLIQEIGGLDGLNIKQLYLGNNAIQTIKGMTKLQSLRILDLSINKIPKLNGLINLISLRSLNMAKNILKNVREIDYLQNLIYLSHLDLSFNPIQERRYYRTQVIYKLPMLKNLDGTPLNSKEVLQAQDFYGLYVEEKFNIFKNKLPEEQFIDRRIHKSELVENETDSQGEQNNFIDDYDEEGRIRTHSSKSRNKSFNGSKRSVVSKGSKQSKRSIQKH